MKTSAILTALAIGALSLQSCGGDQHQKSSTGTDGSEVKQFVLNEVIKSSSASYKVASPGFPDAYLTIRSSVQWPEKIGNYDIKALQDTIIKISFPNFKGSGIDNAITSYVKDYAIYELGDGVTPVDSVPQATAENPAYEAGLKVDMLEITEQTATYAVSYYQYLGGAHPNGGSTPFTYILDEGKVAGLDWLFKPGYEQALTPVLKNAVAAAAGVEPGELQNYMLANSFPITNDVCILEGAIVFHYNPYIILPYSFGSIDANISPYQVRDLLTPQASKLLLE